MTQPEFDNQSHFLTQPQTSRRVVDDEIDFYKIGKMWDNIIDKIPYGWRIYYKYKDLKRIIISKYQTFKYGVSDAECWDLSDTLTKYTLPRLRHFKKMRRHTVPVDMTVEQWEHILDEIIWTFEYMENDEKYNPFPHKNTNITDVESLTNDVPTDEENKSFVQYIKTARSLQKRKEAGLRLFAEHYESLWD